MATLTHARPVSSTDRPVCSRTELDGRNMWLSDSRTARRGAVRACHACPLLASCQLDTAADILAGEPVAGVVRAGVAFTVEGRVDRGVHAELPDWVPAPPSKPDVDPLTIELLFTDPARVRAYVTDDEIAEFIRQIVSRREVGDDPNPYSNPYSVNRIAKALGLHHRRVKAIAQRVGVADSFTQRRRRPVDALLSQSA